MDLFKTDCCCCYFSLRTGGFILGYLGSFNAIVGLCAAIGTQPKFAFSFVVYLILCVSWLYGIHKNKPSWLLLNVALNVTGFCLLVLATIIIIVLIIMGANINDFYVRDTWPIIFVLIPSIVLNWHFTAVCYSLYKMMNEEEKIRQTGAVYQSGG